MSRIRYICLLSLSLLSEPERDHGWPEPELLLALGRGVRPHVPPLPAVGSSPMRRSARLNHSQQLANYVQKFEYEGLRGRRGRGGGDTWLVIRKDGLELRPENSHHPDTKEWINATVNSRLTGQCRLSQEILVMTSFPVLKIKLENILFCGWWWFKFFFCSLYFIFNYKFDFTSCKCFRIFTYFPEPLAVVGSSKSKAVWELQIDFPKPCGYPYTLSWRVLKSYL